MNLKLQYYMFRIWNEKYESKIEKYFFMMKPLGL